MEEKAVTTMTSVKEQLIRNFMEKSCLLCDKCFSDDEEEDECDVSENTKTEMQKLEESIENINLQETGENMNLKGIKIKMCIYCVWEKFMITKLESSLVKNIVTEAICEKSKKIVKGLECFSKDDLEIIKFEEYSLKELENKCLFYEDRKRKRTEFVGWLISKEKDFEGPLFELEKEKMEE
jgi:hypothetical protein